MAFVYSQADFGFRRTLLQSSFQSSEGNGVATVELWLAVTYGHREATATSVWFWLFLASWLAATVSGAAGFGGALLLLPIVTYAVGASMAVPLLTVAQLLGNLSRAWFGYNQIRWRPVAYFTAGAVPASIAGSRLFVAIPKDQLTTGIGVLLVLLVLLRRMGFLSGSINEKWLAPGGALVGFLSALAGSAGPLGALLFVGLNLPPTAYVSSEAVTAVAMHVTKLIVYGRYSLIGTKELMFGLIMGSAMIIGSWTGKLIIQKISRERFVLLVEGLLVVSSLQLIFAK